MVVHNIRYGTKAHSVMDKRCSRRAGKEGRHSKSIKERRRNVKKRRKNAEAKIYALFQVNPKRPKKLPTQGILRVATNITISSVTAERPIL